MIFVNLEPLPCLEMVSLSIGIGFLQSRRSRNCARMPASRLQVAVWKRRDIASSRHWLARSVINRRTEMTDSSPYGWGLLEPVRGGLLEPVRGVTFLLRFT